MCHEKKKKKKKKKALMQEEEEEDEEEEEEEDDEEEERWRTRKTDEFPTQALGFIVVFGGFFSVFKSDANIVHLIFVS